jgi:hypothetical protein
VSLEGAPGTFRRVWSEAAGVWFYQPLEDSALVAENRALRRELAVARSRIDVGDPLGPEDVAGDDW